ncbi:uncharacterized protein H6S33_005627 [Morchella sextelata]|uniref:uncharacterized protein n=1 Tax=Morchella sextelata TaxID=1174677 RepID=UPI001D04A35E|nr:uncharacterized protein H6S33_005627 [Morchella sextelata]KAH0613741.1 hypothetical protein H6S33_005627 [Morchella sextelata]
MAQGTKKLSKPIAAKSGKRTNAGIMKKGRVEIAPKRASLVKANNLNKRLGAQLAAGTERHLAQKAGHLELLAGGKKDKKKATDAKK